MQPAKTLLMVWILCSAVLGCSKPSEPSISFEMFSRMAKGLGVIPCVVTDVSEYEHCKLFLYHNQKAQLLLEQDLRIVGDELCVGLPLSSDKGAVVLAWKDGFSATASPRDFQAGSRSVPKPFRKAAPTMSLMGTTFSPEPDPDDFTGKMWCYVLKFEGEKR